MASTSGVTSFHWPAAGRGQAHCGMSGWLVQALPPPGQDGWLRGGQYHVGTPLLGAACRTSLMLAAAAERGYEDKGMPPSAGQRGCHTGTLCGQQVHPPCLWNCRPCTSGSWISRVKKPASATGMRGTGIRLSSQPRPAGSAAEQPHAQRRHAGMPPLQAAHANKQAVLHPPVWWLSAMRCSLGRWGG